MRSSLKEQKKYNNVTAIVRHGYRGILGRYPDPDAWKSYADFLKLGGSILDFCQALMTSEEYKINRKNLPAKDLARALYLGIFEREPDPEAFENTVKAIQEGRGAERATAMLSSQEFKDRFFLK